MTTLVVGTAIVSHGRVLAARRAYPAAAAGRWELPGGKAHDGESLEVAAVREVREELGCAVEVIGPLEGTSRISDDLDLVVQLARLVEGEPVPSEHDAVRWLAPEELDEVDWLPSDRPFVSELRGLLLSGEALAGGNVGGAVRVGSTVRRLTGPWTPAVHALLEHLSMAGLAATPRVLGRDERDREVLTYLPGRVIDIDAELPSESAVVDAMKWLRRYHRAVADFDHPGPWRNAPTTTPQPGDGSSDRQALICHHDLAPYNVALSSSGDGDRVVGVFDWDMAGPGTPTQDLGFAAWNWVPLYRPLPTAEVAARLRLMADAYGDGVSPREILAAVVPRIDRSIRVITAGQRAGDPGMLNLGRIGEPAATAARLDDLRSRIPDIEQELT